MLKTESGSASTQLKKILAPIVVSWGMSLILAEDSKSFNDAVVVYKNNALRLQIATDRGQPFFLDIASRNEPEDWFDVSLIINAVMKKNLLETHSMDEMIVFLNTHKTRIESLMTIDFDDTKTLLAKQKKQRHNMMFSDVLLDSSKP